MNSIPPMAAKTARRSLGRFRLYAALLLPLALLASCRPTGVRVIPPVALPEAFSVAGEEATPPNWWLAFGDAELDGLIERALRENLSLRTAWDRLDAARAVAAAGGAPLWPSLDATAGGSRSVQKTAVTPRLYTTEYSLGLAAAYEVDLWGRVRSAYDADRLDVYATGEDLHAAAITLTAEIAGLWYRIIEERGQLELLDEQIATNEKVLEIITLKFRRGRVSATDVLQQREVIEATKGERILVESSLTVLAHQLAVLLGQVPGRTTPAAGGALPTLPPLPATGVPAEWVRRRPDVRAAELRVQAADRRVAAAIADRFPRLSLSAGASTSAEQMRDLFDNWLASLAANIVAPLVDGGRRRAEVERTRAVVSERLNAYGSVILRAIREVEDALWQEHRQAEYVGSLARQLALSEKATRQTLEKYIKGTPDFTRYLATLLAHQRLQRTVARAQRQLVQFRIDLYRALAGPVALIRPPRAELSGPREPVNDPTGEAAAAASSRPALKRP